LTHTNIFASALSIKNTFALTGSDRCLNVMPLFHVHGLIGSVLSSLTAGGSIVCAPGFYAPRFFEWIEEFHPTWYTAVPTIHQAIMARSSSNREVIERCPLRFIRSCSSALPPKLMAELEGTFKVPVIESYGMTEAAHQMTSNPLPPGERKPGSVGVAAGSQVAIMDEAGNPLPPGQTGEIVICGANVLLGYENNSTAHQSASDRHALEQRCAFDTGIDDDRSAEAFALHRPGPDLVWLVALTSIHWREAWKYGERAFRYCQHDLGHAIAAVRIAAALAGLRARILPDWSQTDIAALVGIDRDADFLEAEREEPGCILEVVSRQSSVVSRESPVVSREALLDAVRAGRWTGRANQLSEDHVQWTFIDDIARANTMAANSSITDDVINIASGVETSLTELAETLGRVMGVNLPPEYLLTASRSIPAKAAVSWSGMTLF
jgi:acyl-CoA synthetase (AMP-forming)/AMP-acid ligase II